MVGIDDGEDREGDQEARVLAGDATIPPAAMMPEEIDHLERKVGRYDRRHGPEPHQIGGNE